MFVSTLAQKHFRFEFDPDTGNANLIGGGKTFKARVDKTVRHVNGKEWENPADGSWNQRVASCVNAGTIVETEMGVAKYRMRTGSMYAGFTSSLVVARLKHKFTIHFTVVEGDVPFALEDDEYDGWDWFHDRDGLSDETQ
jgi:hypothetical protein